MTKIKSIINYFTKAEIILWTSSVLLIILCHFIFGNQGALKLCASLVGVTAIIFCAKGNPTGPALMIVFSILYAIISFSFSYYGELITYLFMSAPMSTFSLISWARNPHKKGEVEVSVGKLTRLDSVLMPTLCVAVTVIFYFLLGYFNTANLLTSTFSVSTSFAAAYLSFRRSPYYALAYMFNDIVLIILWVLASFSDVSYLSVIVCFVLFLANDTYGFINWKRMEKRQKKNADAT